MIALPRNNTELHIDEAKLSAESIKFHSGKRYWFSMENGKFSAASNEIRLVTNCDGKRFVLKKVERGTRSENELQLLEKLSKSKLGRSNVMRMRDVGACGENLYCIMDYMDGPDCSTLIQKMKIGFGAEVDAEGQDEIALMGSRQDRGAKRKNHQYALGGKGFSVQ